MPFRCEFSIESDTRYLTALRAFVQAASEIAGEREFPRRAIIPCSLALVEAVDNAIFHAHSGARRLPVGVAIELGGGRIVIKVVDEGRGIGHQKMPEPESEVTHGRGLFLIRSLMSSVRSRTSKGRHTMRMEYMI